MARVAADDRFGWVIDAVLRPYAQIIFSRSRISGGLILCAIATAPRVAGYTLLAVVAAQATSWLAGLGTAAVREGVHASAAVLTALALAYGLGQPAPALVAVKPILSVPR